ncbi:glycosyltransferase family 2 protein [Alkalihalobacillus deserti]|uniref:glycosyltransferase family 2 protein n=1 Tax=Alkalihalobacillus deserti TaxID=2879466 RepID=UPI001D14B493|nr:glycosyltransferase [Alkalihalobacillus deserti]
MKPKVSIIIPIYNVESYLIRCLESLVAQKIREIEIIAINDGSTDKSLEILNEFAKKDHRIIVIDKENGGVSSARNAGIQLAKGEFIGFVDPDDWINVTMYQDMYQTAITDRADIVMCSYIREFGSHSKEKDFQLDEKVLYKDRDVQSKMMRRLIGPVNEEIASPELLDAWGTVWSKLYKTEIIKGNKVTFTDLSEIGTNEDSLFNIQAFYYAKSFVFVNKPYYHYWRANETSVTTGYKPLLIKKWLNLYGIIEGFLQEKELGKEFYIALNNRICLNTLGLGLNEMSESNRSSNFEKIRNLHSILHDERIQRSFKQFEMQYFSFVWRAFYFCAKTKRAVGLYFMLASIEKLRKIVR